MKIWTIYIKLVRNQLYFKSVNSMSNLQNINDRHQNGRYNRCRVKSCLRYKNNFKVSFHNRWLIS